MHVLLAIMYTKLFSTVYHRILAIMYTKLFSTVYHHIIWTPHVVKHDENADFTVYLSCS